MSKAQQALTTAIRRQMHAFEMLREILAGHLGLGLSELVALGHLYDEGPLTARNLGDRLRLTSGSVTALINRLEASDFAQRVENPEDRRSVLIEICPAGEDAWTWLLEQITTPISRAVRASDFTNRQAINMFESVASQMDEISAQLS
jgi:DNA-binding MarR family transcriptional regulator